MEKNFYLEQLVEQHNRFRAGESNQRLGSGQMTAMRNYVNSLRHGSELYEITQLPSEDYIDEFMTQLIMADVCTVAITARDTSLIDFLRVIYKRGWRLKEVGTLQRHDHALVPEYCTVNCLLMTLGSP